MLQRADRSEMCVSQMAVILMSLGVALTKSKVAELFLQKTALAEQLSTWVSSAASLWTK